MSREEFMGTETREVRTGGRGAATSSAHGLSACPTTSGLSHWERPLSSRGGRTLGTKGWTLSQTKHLYGAPLAGLAKTVV
jgi:hypothetical protein